MSILKVIRKMAFILWKIEKIKTTLIVFMNKNNHPTNDDCDIKMMLCVKISKRPFVAGK
jgi:hypothetical protein